MAIGVQAMHHGTMKFRRWRAQEHGQDVLAAALYEGNGRARERIDRWWTAGGAHRDEVWRGAWFLLTEAHFRFGNHERPERVVPVLEFLLEADPASPYRPQVRLTACLPQTAADAPNGVYRGDPEVPRLVEAALRFPDPGLRQRLADLLSVTDQPGLLDAMETAFRPRARLGPTYIGAAPPGHETRCDLWLGGEPSSFLKIVCANPNLPRPPARPDDIDLSLLALLKDRLDLLPAFEQGALAVRLLEYLRTWLPEQVHDRCRRVLRDLSAREGVTAVCDQAILGDAEAIAAARDAGYRPASPAWTPIFLLLTRQFSAYREADPNGRVLQAMCSVDGLRIGQDVIIDRILAILDTDLPDDVAAAVRRSLRDLGPLSDSSVEDIGRRGMRRAVLARAIKLSRRRSRPWSTRATCPKTTKSCSRCSSSPSSSSGTTAKTRTAQGCAPSSPRSVTGTSTSISGPSRSGRDAQIPGRPSSRRRRGTESLPGTPPLGRAASASAATSEPEVPASAQYADRSDGFAVVGAGIIAAPGGRSPPSPAGPGGRRSCRRAYMAGRVRGRRSVIKVIAPRVTTTLVTGFPVARVKGISA